MTDRIKEFLARNREDGPRLVVDLDVVRENYLGFAKALPDTRVFYAVKANPAPEILSLLAELGSCFDAASMSGRSLARSWLKMRWPMLKMSGVETVR